MSYAIRNSLVIAGLLVIIWVSAGTYIFFRMDGKADDLKASNRQISEELKQASQVAAEYDNIFEINKASLHDLENYPKRYVHPERVDRIYELIRQYNRGHSYTELNFTLMDQTASGEKETARITLEGRGRYSRLAGFIKTIELEPDLLQITQVRIDPISATDALGDVRFLMEIDVAVSGEKELKTAPAARVVNTHRWTGGNPFFPLIHQPPPNTENLPDIRDARLSGVSVRSAWVTLADGSVQNLRPGDEVYLGRLDSISPPNRTAEFRLNEGGIVRTLVLNM